MTYEYDLADRLEAGGTTTFTYDVRDRMIGVTQDATTVAMYVYGAQGLRISKGVDGAEVRNLYDGRGYRRRSDPTAARHLDVASGDPVAVPFHQGTQWLMTRFCLLLRLYEMRRAFRRTRPLRSNYEMGSEVAPVVRARLGSPNGMNERGMEVAFEDVESSLACGCSGILFGLVVC